MPPVIDDPVALRIVALLGNQPELPDHVCFRLAQARRAAVLRSCARDTEVNPAASGQISSTAS